MVSPYLFNGGNISEYEVFTGDAGTYNTRHIPTGKSIPCVQPSGFDMLPIANLAFGVLNLGVGVYNAFQLQKIQKKLDHLGYNYERNHEQIQFYFKSIQDALSGHQRTLEVLVYNQYTLSQKMDILREEMYSGFERVVQEIQDVEANRRGKEFYANMYTMLRVYERFVNHLPDLSEADRLIDRAEKLEALLQAELHQIPKGNAERLPFVTALTFSIRAKADAFEAKGGKYVDSADQTLNELKEQIRQEAYALCDGRSIYTMGVQIPEILYQYALLIRGIDRGLELRLNSEIEFVLSPIEIIWNDGLDDFRSIFDKSALASTKNSGRITEATKIKLNTLSDYDWYIRFASEDRLNFNVHSRQSIQLSEILKRVGHPNPIGGMICRSDLNTLMKFSLPEPAEKFEHYIQEEFHWEKRPNLRGSL